MAFIADDPKLLILRRRIFASLVIDSYWTSTLFPPSVDFIGLGDRFRHNPTPFLCPKSRFPRVNHDEPGGRKIAHVSRHYGKAMFQGGRR